LETIAEKQTEAGLFKEAVSTAKQINDKDDRSDAFERIAEKQTDSKIFKGETEIFQDDISETPFSKSDLIDI
ncbi:MAG: hypothetical protein H8E71_06840, partial [Candidatus Marinimicrobia bacterium]|nr:hypothetical protein [Candidatus Neomarinimicrobiota bacterium]